MTTEKSASIWTRAFALLCLAQFLGYAQHFMLAPVLPLYVTDLGGSPFVVGLVLASFAVTSVVIRPLVGHWADRWSETGVLISGLLFQGASVFLCLIPMIEAVMLANALRGLGWAGLNTGGYSLLALTAPESRRGEASGLLQRRPGRRIDNLSSGRALAAGRILRRIQCGICHDSTALITGGGRWSSDDAVFAAHNPGAATRTSTAVVARSVPLCRTGNLPAIGFAPLAEPRIAEHD